jgi:hypothetical protein
MRTHAATRLNAHKLEASPSQGAAVKALKQMGFHHRKIEKDGDSIQVLTSNDRGEIFLTLNSDSLQALKAMFARDENLQLHFYTMNAVQVGVSVASKTVD